MIKIKIEEKRNSNFIFKVAITNDDISKDRILKRLLMEGKKIRGEYTYEIPLRFLLPILNNYNKDNIEIDNESIVEFFQFSDIYDEKYYYTTKVNDKYMQLWISEQCPHIYKVSINRESKEVNYRIAFKSKKY
ncbi:hypothetical protein KQI30_11190 [Clostridium bornimense]|uniref:hypothetical protein n=1 Tax=Clostridium bornimense TaxID=1216932 RepID=UPI001C1176D2|nr:hypothetical protein [Clostridium bornimense]MBU5316830.1 hypothetical protein [Clostridium bornimense]